MVAPGLTIELFPFQEDTVIKLLDLVVDPKAKQIITIKSPTGSGKTIILIDFIEEFLTNVSDNVAFIWLCPGKGNLEEQSRAKMQKFAPHRNTQSLPEALTAGFAPGTTTFINWELVTKQDNIAIRDSERRNLFERIAAAHRENINFIIIIDEEHSNDTAKARTIIDAFAAKHIIRVSATARENSLHEFIEIDEQDVIDAGLITKAVYVNEGITDEMVITSEYDCLLELADVKRKAIAEEYHKLGKTIRPLVLIQFPNGKPEAIKAVEEKLEALGYTYDNRMVSKWMSKDHVVPEDITENDGQSVFLLMKQAISTGWDCPRAKILVKLREGMNENFEIQTIGRIRRMPETVHYENDLLDFCYVYTFDEKYKEGLLSDIDKAYEIRRLFLKKKCKTFTLEKETRDLDFNSLGEREVLKKIYDSLKEKYNLTKNKERNKEIFEAHNYQLGGEIISNVLHGRYTRIDQLTASTKYRTVRMKVDTHAHGMMRRHSVDAIKSAVGMSNEKVKVMLEHLFRKNDYKKYKLLSLPVQEFYAFVINNENLLRKDFKEVTGTMTPQPTLIINPKKSLFRIPEQDFYRYDATVTDEVEYLSNAYEEYTSGYATTKVRSTCESLFENYCENKDDIEWVYKNGDTGQQYFSIVYLDGLQRQFLFYADYIVKKKDGTVWVIETKGGESHGQNMNIDVQIENKFNAFKNYAEEKNICWGFVRYDNNYHLRINNTVFAQDMADSHWEPIENIF